VDYGAMALLLMPEQQLAELVVHKVYIIYAL
jgi:hypothetical protein